MSNNNTKNIVIILLILIIVALISFILINNNNNKYKDNNEINNEVKNKENNLEDNSDTTNDNEIIENNTNNEDITYTEDNTTNEDVVYTEDDVINYVNNIENEVNNSNISDNIKEKFINIVDFIFYDKEINGYKFSELTNSAKLKVISICLKIDNKIEENIPNYKETISSKYNDIKNELVMLYLDTTISICSNNKEECEYAKNLFSDIKETCKIGFDYIKDVLVNGKNKLKDYYEIFRNS